jgi:hypothetical protein
MHGDPQLAVPKSDLEMARLTFAMYKLEIQKPVLSMSEICQSWIDQCQSGIKEDMLVVGFSLKEIDNPFKEIKGQCIIL